MRYFELFDIETRYDIDLQLLEKQYLHLQKQYHPDNALSELEKREMLRFSMLINDAYKIVLHPVKRIEYMLKESGHSISDENSRYQLPPQDLQYFLDTQEQIDECDVAITLDTIRNQIEEKIHSTQNHITVSWNQQSVVELEYYGCLLKYLYNLQQYLTQKVETCK